MSARAKTQNVYALTSSTKRTLTLTYTLTQRALTRNLPQADYFAEGDIADYDFDVWILRALHKQRNFDENILKDS